MRLRGVVVALVLVLASACGEGRGRKPAVDGGEGGSGPVDVGQAGAGEASAPAAPEGGSGGAEPIDSGDAGEGGRPTGPDAGGAAGGPSFELPVECPGTLEDYTQVVEGSAEADFFTEEELDGQAVILGGVGDDVFPSSPPGAGDCLLGEDGDDRFETAFLSAPSTLVGGPGADTFVLGGSLEDDVAHIVDFRREGDDRIVLDALVYGLDVGTTEEAPTLSQLGVVAGFQGGNSTAGSGVRILYNPEDGGVWYDSDEDGEIAEAVQIAVIDNFSEYDFSLEDWGLE
ncbi:MAG: hypothetical protein EOO73_33200 [Myxococcales bacterium]|nr:MAG: hypothetical protein EOO73_33200 [Myxococcales bacterium]